MAMAASSAAASSDSRLIRLPPRRGQIKARILKGLIMAVLEAIHARNNSAPMGSGQTPYLPIRPCSTN